MTDITPERVWKWLDANGPAEPRDIERALAPEAYCPECGACTDEGPRCEVSDVLKVLLDTGTGDFNVDWEFQALGDEPP